MQPIILQFQVLYFNTTLVTWSVICMNINLLSVMRTQKHSTPDYFIMPCWAFHQLTYNSHFILFDIPVPKLCA